ncbi:hypothetical protein [uncultured Draconibacterium sp.]|uniref:hypothetical protein n=1 Tax=uncultured Draconibacterium sp. TaxID=1573823 RepID=UPI0029C8B95D|nr:hypothetical protein [uncultured Draconibacterium sp.]
MKKWVYTTVVALIAAGGIFWSCQKDETLTNPDEGLMLKKAKIAEIESLVSWNPTVCAGEEHEFIIDTEVGTNVQAQQLEDGEWIQVFQMNKTTEFPQKFYLTFETTGEYQLRFKVGNRWSENNAKLVVENCDMCDDALFSYATDDNLDIVFSYNHDEKAEITIAFTFPQVEDLELNDEGNYEAPDGKVYSLNNPKNQTVFTWTGEIGCNASEPTTFEFGFAPDCSSGNAKDGQATIWTDTKILAINGEPVIMTEDDLSTPDIDETVIGYSVKGDLSNIVYTGCPK